MAHDVAEEFLGIPLEGLKFGVILSDEVRLGLDLGAKKRSQADQLYDLNPLQPFQENDHISVGHFYGFVDLGQCSDLVQVGGGRVFHPRIKLGHHAHQFFVASQRINERQRTLPAYRERQNRARKQDCIPNWQNRKDLRYREFFFSHEIPQRTTPNSLDQLDATDGPKVQILRTFKAINLSVSY